MKVLIVNNSSGYPTLIAESFKGAEVTVKAYDELATIHALDFDCAVLSGSSSAPVSGNEEGPLSQELEFIRHAGIPILGICFGFELIVVAFGGKLKRMSEKAQGVTEMTIKTPDAILQNIEHLFVYEGHRWIASSIPSELTVLAESEHGVEAVKHREKMIYGFQFHPEKLARETEGKKIIENFIVLVSA